MDSIPISETAKARERLGKYCQGNGIDIGFGGDPITPSAIAIDMEVPYLTYNQHPQNLKGDGRNLYWFRNEVLDYVYSSHLLEDFPEQETPFIILEWLRVLKPGGYLVIYCPDEPNYREYCKKTGQKFNEWHKVSNFGLKFLVGVLETHFKGKYEIVHEIELVDEYSFDLVVRKLR